MEEEEGEENDELTDGARTWMCRCRFKSVRVYMECTWCVLKAAVCGAPRASERLSCLPSLSKPPRSNPEERRRVENNENATKAASRRIEVEKYKTN
jgi:hypothetical protein